MTAVSRAIALFPLFLSFIGITPKPTHAETPPLTSTVPSGWLGLDWQAVGAIGTWVGFIAVVIGLLYARKQIVLFLEQLRFTKDTVSADLIVRLDERYCSEYFQTLRQKAEALKDKLNKRQGELTQDERENLINFLGFFELLGMYEHKDYVSLEALNVMFGSAVIQYREEFADFIDKGPWWKYLQALYTKLKQSRNVGLHVGA